MLIIPLLSSAQSERYSIFDTEDSEKALIDVKGLHPIAELMVSGLTRWRL